MTRAVFRFSFQPWVKDYGTYLRIKTVLEGDNVWMRVLDELAHNLKLSILESLVLQDLLDRYDLPSLHHLGLKNHPKRSISNDAFCGVRYVLFSQRTLGVRQRGARVRHTLCGGSGGY
jgi:hypothetical protein